MGLMLLNSNHSRSFLIPQNDMTRSKFIPMFNKSCIHIINKIESTSIYTKYKSFYWIKDKKKYCQTLIYHKKEMVTEEVEAIICNGIKKRKAFRNQNIVNVIDSFQDYENVYLILDSSNCYSLDLFLNEDLDPVSILSQIFSGIFYLRQKNVCSGTITPRNIEINRETGLVKLNLDNFNNQRYFFTYQPQYLEYVAPELMYQNTSNYADLYSIGVIMKKIFGFENELVEELTGDVDRRSKIDFDCIKGNSIFAGVDWNMIQPKPFQKLNPKQMNISDFFEYYVLDDLYPVPHQYGCVDGFGRIFNITGVRYLNCKDIDTHVWK